MSWQVPPVLQSSQTQTQTEMQMQMQMQMQKHPDADADADAARKTQTQTLPRLQDLHRYPRPAFDPQSRGMGIGMDMGALPPIDAPPSPQSTESCRSSLDVRQQLSALHVSAHLHSLPSPRSSSYSAAYSDRPRDPRDARDTDGEAADTGTGRQREREEHEARARAPAIAPTMRFPYPHPNADSPTKGFPYAFPDPGQRTADRGTSTASSVHRNSLETPYSRSPDLRVSHKLAERKRRREMKDLFEDLKDALPVERCVKTSKWEVLSKAVEYIHSIRSHNATLQEQVDQLWRENEALKRNMDTS